MEPGISGGDRERLQAFYSFMAPDRVMGHDVDD